jgi:hypothetical protein
MNTVATVELDSLLQMAAGAALAGVGVTVAFALAVRGMIAAAERRREGSRLAAGGAGALAATALLAGLGAVVVGLLLVAR